MFNTEQDYLDDIAALTRRIEYLKTENAFLKREVKRLGDQCKQNDLKDRQRIRDGDG